MLVSFNIIYNGM